MEKLIQALEKCLPEVFAEKAIAQLIPGLYSTRYLANLRSRGEGPKHFKIGRRVMYRKEDFITWIKNRLEVTYYE
jgi:hypothetical protein